MKHTLFDIFKDYVPQIAAVVVSIGTAVAGWFAGRKKSKTELRHLQAQVDGSELQNVEHALAIYRDMVEDLSKRIQEQKGQLRSLQRQNQELLIALEKADGENQQLIKKIGDLEKTLKSMHNPNKDN